MTPTPHIVVFPSVNRAVFGELCPTFNSIFHWLQGSENVVSKCAVILEGIYMNTVSTCLYPKTVGNLSMHVLGFIRQTVHTGLKCWKPPMMRMILEICSNNDQSLLGVSGVPEIVLNRKTVWQTDRSAAWISIRWPHIDPPKREWQVLYLGIQFLFLVSV